MTVMIDANIIFAAIKNPAGKPMKAFIKATQPPNRIVLCDQIVDEVRKAFSRKFPADTHLIDKFFTWAVFETVLTPSQDEANNAEDAIRDETDRPILRAAIAAKVDILITGDNDFLQSEIKEPRILTAAEFIRDY
jgi:putative PIN family toxin of toxin-antitoxin system